MALVLTAASIALVLLGSANPLPSDLPQSRSAVLLMVAGLTLVAGLLAPRRWVLLLVGSGVVAIAVHRRVLDAAVEAAFWAPLLTLVLLAATSFIRFDAASQRRRREEERRHPSGE